MEKMFNYSADKGGFTKGSSTEIPSTVAPKENYAELMDTFKKIDSQTAPTGHAIEEPSIFTDPTGAIEAPTPTNGVQPATEAPSIINGVSGVAETPDAVTGSNGAAETPTNNYSNDINESQTDIPEFGAVSSPTDITAQAVSGNGTITELPTESAIDTTAVSSISTNGEASAAKPIKDATTDTDRPAAPVTTSKAEPWFNKFNPFKKSQGQPVESGTSKAAETPTVEQISRAPETESDEEYLTEEEIALDFADMVKLTASLEAAVAGGQELTNEQKEDLSEANLLLDLYEELSDSEFELHEKAESGVALTEDENAKLQTLKQREKIYADLADAVLAVESPKKESESSTPEPEIAEGAQTIASMVEKIGSAAATTGDVTDQVLGETVSSESSAINPATDAIAPTDTTVAPEAAITTEAPATSIDQEPVTTEATPTSAELTAEQRAEKFAKVAEIAAVFDQGVKDQFKGLTDQQIARFTEFKNLQEELGSLENLTEEENNALIDAEEKAKVAFAHHLAYLKADPTISREVRIQKYTDFQKIMDPESWEAQQQTEEGRAQWEAELAASFPVEKKSKEKRKKIDWRRQAIEASGVAFQEQVGQKAEANKQVIIDGVITALDRAANVAAQVGTVPDRVGRVKDVTVAKAINLGNGIGIAVDGSVNFLGTVGEIYYGVITAIPAAAVTVGAEALLKTGQLGEKLNTAMETGVKKGVDAVKQQIEKVKERVRQSAERDEAARQARITELKTQANSLNAAAEKFKADAAQAKGLRGWLNRLANQ